MNVTSTFGANLYDIMRRKPSRRAPNLKQPRAPKMKNRLCIGGKVRFHHTLSFMTKQRSQFGCDYPKREQEVRDR